MGIIGLWDVIKNEDHSVPTAQLAEDHFKRHGRPLRIAVDEPDWRFNNLTSQQVNKIREGKPWKRGKRGQGTINKEERRLLEELLDYFRIPHHEAPGEAEAECARLQQLDVVDAVWSQDSDTLMFGCNVLVRYDRVSKDKLNNNRSKENTKKSATSVRVVYGHDIREKHNFDREGLVLFVMLCGGDYDKGLRNCGSVMATAAVRAGLGTSLCQCRTRADCALWRNKLFDFFLTQRGARPRPELDPAFPDINTLDKYYRPKVSADDQLQNLRGLRNGWNVAINELKLLELTSSRFNIRGRFYMNWVGPVLLTKSLVARDPTSPKEHLHQIKLTKRRTQSQPPPLLRSLAFSPFGLTKLQQKDVEPEHTVNADIPTYLLQRLLPSSVLDPPLKPKRIPGKRKRQAEEDAESRNITPVIATERELSTSLSKRANTRRASASPFQPEPTMSGRSYVPDSTPGRHSRSNRPIRFGTECISLLSNSEEDTTPLQRRSSIIDLGDSLPDSEDEDEDKALNQAIQLSLQKPDAPTALRECTRTGSMSKSIVGASKSSSRLDSALSSVVREGTSQVSCTSPPTAAVAAPQARYPKGSSGSGAAEVRAARLRFFTSSTNVGEKVTPKQAVISTQVALLSTRSNRNTEPRLLPEDIETIDLT
ncbi:uncharacterized protein N0V89_003623 [Didymosphaeria variabile]|uniref:XPG-I domain-containing protein n=1 Tax=Didymosphaeria variabile TaxID=1932322 RepID=A0A9W8XMZ7_9PLEO|nr:uncharacterized protein N0V89_003623 [Didymosphaeria variabile]KAJ4355603.1 hypothetical protein N0V89_003623 [Didymosphaeria variabile]